MTWRIGLAFSVLAIAAGLGCRQQTFLIEPDGHDAPALPYPTPPLPEPGADIVPRAGTLPPPTTVEDTQRQARYLSLREAIAIALENGTIGVQSPLAPGTAIDTLGGFAPPNVQSADGIRVLAFDPAIIANNIEISLSKFDTMWNTSLTWDRVETALGISPTSFLMGSSATQPAAGTGANHTSVVGNTFSTALIKPLPTGGVAGITFNINSAHNFPSSTINPAIQPSLQFQFEQPLLQGFGVEINQLRPNHPGSVLTPFNTTTGVEGILITRIRFDQERAEFQRNLNYLLLNVETAYWNLYGAYYQLYSREEGMRYAYESWRLTRQLFENGRAPIQTVAQIRLQYEQFRSQRLTALGQVLESERQLRGLLGLKVEDGCRLVPADAPLLAPVKPDWATALNQALALRPELLLARQELKFRQLDLIRLRNNLLPDLRFVATDNIHAVGSQLDGGRSPDNALHNLVTDPFNNWSAGLQMSIPIGFRAAHAEVRQAQLALQRSYVSLLTDEDKAERFLALPYRQLLEFQDQIQVNRAALEAATEQLEGYFNLFRQGRAAASDANLILALQNFSNSVASYYAAIVQYNDALATFEFAKGTIMGRDSVFIQDGPLPKCAQVQAVEHERQRTEALVLRAATTPGPSAACDTGESSGSAPAVPYLATDTPLSLPALQHGRPPVPVIPADSGGPAGPVARLLPPP